MSSPIVVYTFFSSLLKQPSTFFDQLINIKLLNIETIGDEECYVISADLKPKNKVKIWISKKRNIILKQTTSSEAPVNELMPEITNEQATEILKNEGEEVTEKTITEMKHKLQPVTSNVNMFLTETQTQISSPELTPADFQFTLPEGDVFKESSDSN